MFACPPPPPRSTRSAFLFTPVSAGYGSVASHAAVKWQGLLDLGGLAGLALVHQAVGEGVFSCRPGLLGELEQHRPCDHAVVLVAEQLL